MARTRQNAFKRGGVSSSFRRAVAAAETETMATKRTCEDIDREMRRSGGDGVRLGGGLEGERERERETIERDLQNNKCQHHRAVLWFPSLHAHPLQQQQPSPPSMLQVYWTTLLYSW